MLRCIVQRGMEVYVCGESAVSVGVVCMGVHLYAPTSF